MVGEQRNGERDREIVEGSKARGREDQMENRGARRFSRRVNRDAVRRLWSRHYIPRRLLLLLLLQLPVLSCGHVPTAMPAYSHMHTHTGPETYHTRARTPHGIGIGKHTASWKALPDRATTPFATLIRTLGRPVCYLFCYSVVAPVPLSTKRRVCNGVFPTYPPVFTRPAAPRTSSPLFETHSGSLYSLSDFASRSPRPWDGGNANADKAQKFPLSLLTR